jgi:hypothetical protein
MRRSIGARSKSGYASRQKAAVRRATSAPAVALLLLIANQRLWIGSSGVVFDVDQSPSFAALRADVLASLNRFQEWRSGGHRIGNVLEDTIRHDLPGPGEEPKDVWIAAHRAVSDRYATLAHLQENGRWRNLYRCANCSEWFYAWRDPREGSRPFCGRKCWPSKQPIRSVGPRRRVTTRRTKTP